MWWYNRQTPRVRCYRASLARDLRSREELRLHKDSRMTTVASGRDNRRIRSRACIWSGDSPWVARSLDGGEIRHLIYHWNALIGQSAGSLQTLFWNIIMIARIDIMSRLNKIQETRHAFHFKRYSSRVFFTQRSQGYICSNITCNMFACSSTPSTLLPVN